MKETGAAEWVANGVLAAVQGVAGSSILAFDATVSLLTVFVSNTMTAGAAVAVLSPVILKMSVAAGHDPLIAGFLAAISSASGYLTPAAQPAFTIIYASGYLKAADFFKVGSRMMLLSFLILMALATFYWPELGP
jgi:sodium-dependent dicarboxylate transporter 2/3/5